MRPRKGARFDIFLIFAGLALLLVAGLQAVLWLERIKTLELDAETGFAIAGVAGTGLVLLLCVAAWLVCDERIAKPFERLAGGSPQAGIRAATTQGESAPGRALMPNTAPRDRDRDHLALVLGELPSAVVLLNADNRLVLFNACAARLLAHSVPARLNARIDAFLDARALSSARRRMQRSGLEVDFAIPVCGRTLAARLRPLECGNALLLLGDTADGRDPSVQAPLVHDFSLLTSDRVDCDEDKPLGTMGFVVLASETSGLLPHRDHLLRLSAVRMMGASILPQDRLDLRIDPDMERGAAPGRVDPAPARRRSAGRCDVATAATRLHDFARDAVIVAHNAPFRMAFLRRQDAVTGLVWSQPVIDLVLLSALLFGPSADHGLAALAGRVGIDMPASAAPGTPAQALVQATVLKQLLPLLAEQHIDSLGALLLAQKRQAEILDRRR